MENVHKTYRRCIQILAPKIPYNLDIFSNPLRYPSVVSLSSPKNSDLCHRQMGSISVLPAHRNKISRKKQTVVRQLETNMDLHCRDNVQTHSTKSGLS